MITLVLGGTRSGKSAFAEKLALKHGGAVLYVATAMPDDPEMMERIQKHKARRPKEWHTIEAPLNLADKIIDSLAYLSPSSILIDCVTLWIANILFHLPDAEDAAPFEKTLLKEVRKLLKLMEDIRNHWILVSGETNLGGISQNKVGRIYNDGLGIANQMLAAKADKAYLVIAGRFMELQK